MLTLLVVGNMIGSGIFLLPASLASYGSISLIAGLITAFGAIMLALVFAKLSTLIPKSGGPYIYASVGFGEFIGFQSVYSYWIALWLGCVAIVMVLTGYLQSLFPDFMSPTLMCLISMAMVWLVTFMNILGVRIAGIVQVTTTVLKLFPLIMLLIIGWFYFHPDYLLSHFNTSQQTDLKALSHAGVLILWAFIGLESATVVFAISKDPRRNVPRATIMGTLIVAVIYLMVSFVLMGMISNDRLLHSTSPFVLAAQMVFGHWGGWLVAIFAMISCIGTLNGWTLLYSQLTLAAADNKLFPSVFGIRNRHDVPALGMVLTATLISVTLILTLSTDLIHEFDFIIVVATLASLMPYVYSCLTELLLLRELPGLPNKDRRIHSYIALFGLIFAWWSIFGAGQETIIYMLIFLITSLPLYIFQRLTKR